MSDDEFIDDDEVYDLDYSSDEDEEPDANLENLFYYAKQLRESEKEKALEQFEKVVKEEGDVKGEWGFKARKQMVKIYFKMNDHEKMKECYENLLTYIESSVTRNHSEKSINSILDFISSSNSRNEKLLEEIYGTTLKQLEGKNERLWFKTNLKLGNLYVDRKNNVGLDKIIKELRSKTEGKEEQKKGTQLLEIYALEIQLYTEKKETKKLKDLYYKSLDVKAAIAHPLIMGIIRECGGKMHLMEKEFDKAYEDFFKAFTHFDESGSQRRIDCLRYLVLANMLTQSTIDPFNSQETKSYKDNPEIQAMTKLVTAYQKSDLDQFNVIKKDTNISKDQFIKEHIEDLQRNIRTKVLINIIRPYRRIKLDFLSKELKMNENSEDVEALIVQCILNRVIEGRIDQVNRLLEVEKPSPGISRCNALDKWTTQLRALQSKIGHQVN